ncbi:phytoene synthase [Microcoleus sp. C2C3]|uniref:15-cis-phytoene synthase CrtB n=1 Tax=unclassified Microcoleus TaxID=2642155 RepID=UPI002FD46C4D
MLQLSKLQCMRTLASVDDSYELCRQVTASYAKNFYLGTQLMPESKRRAIWAIYVWCRRTDELVDGPGSDATTPETLNLWEKRLESVFAGHPHDDYDVALVDTLSHFPIDIQPFREMIAGQQMDLYRSRYETFEELNLYCYRVAGTVGLMSMSVMGVGESSSAANWNWHWGNRIPKEEAISLGIAKQLTNILRDVGEDARRGRIYIPLEDLALFNYTEEDLFNGVIDNRWRELMRFQIQRARKLYASAEPGIKVLSPDIRWTVWAATMLYSRILNAIERNQYDVFQKRAYVSNSQKLLCLPAAWLKSKVL